MPHPGLHPDKMTDEAPRSSMHVMRRLSSVAIPDRVLAQIEIVTMADRDDRAVTRVSRPVAQGPADQELWDQEIQRALRSLKGAGNSMTITMGRWFTIEWDGICRPV